MAGIFKTNLGFHNDAVDDGPRTLYSRKGTRNNADPDVTAVIVIELYPGTSVLLDATNHVTLLTDDDAYCEPWYGELNEEQN